jgi:hypothetical protein
MIDIKIPERKHSKRKYSLLTLLAIPVIILLLLSTLFTENAQAVLTLNKKAETLSYGGYIYAMAIDSTYIYAGGGTTLRVYQYWKSNMTKKAQTASYGGVIVAIAVDATYMYVGGATTNKVYQYWKSNLTKKAETLTYGGGINNINAVNDTYLYAGGTTTQKVYQYWKSNLTKKAETLAYGGSIRAIVIDDTFIYACGLATYKVYKYWISNMTKKTESGSYGAHLLTLQIDDTYIYAGGDTTQKVYKYWKSNLTKITESADLGGGVKSLALAYGGAVDANYIYASGGEAKKVYKLWKSNLTEKAETLTYGGTISAVVEDDTYVYAGGDTTYKVYQYWKDADAPTSSVNALTPYWKNFHTMVFNGTASDTESGVNRTEVWYRYSSDNASWGAWTLASTDTTYWQNPAWVFDFDTHGGNGFYQFYSRAYDNSTNYEVAPGSADAMCGYDNVAPTSSVDAITSYWHSSTLVINATANDNCSGVYGVALWYNYSVDNITFVGYTNFGLDTASPWSWSFDFPDGNGYYEFYSKALDNNSNWETPPVSADELAGYDDATPTTWVDTILPPYWKNTNPLPIDFAFAPPGVSGLAEIELIYKEALDNSSWSGWLIYGSVYGIPWTIDFDPTVVFSDNGHYQFASRGKSGAGLWETHVGVADEEYGYDNNPPSSLAEILGTYWKTSPITISGLSTDAYPAESILDSWASGTKNVSLLYRYSPDNISFGGWTLFGTNTTPWLTTDFNFGFSNGSGYYEFYTTSYDNATNYEVAPGSADVICGYDGDAPTSSVDAIAPYWKTTAPLTITVTANDVGMGLDDVELWYRYSADNSSWGAWTLFDTNTTPWLPISFIFDFSDGSGYYEFYTRSHDNATNYEVAPGSADQICGYDIGFVGSFADGILPYWHTSLPVTITTTAVAGPSGIADVELWYRYSTDNATWGAWTLKTTETNSPWSFYFPQQFAPPGGWTSVYDGYYEFYTRAHDNASHYENAPLTNDTTCAIDITAPTSAVDPIIPYNTNVSWFILTANATDNVSGVDTNSLYLWYRNSPDNATWGAWTQLPLNIPYDPFVLYYWINFSFPIYGYFEFYSIVSDVLGNTEIAPVSADASVNFTPTSFALYTHVYPLDGSTHIPLEATSIGYLYGTLTHTFYVECHIWYPWASCWLLVPKYPTTYVGSGAVPITLNFDLSGQDFGGVDPSFAYFYCANGWHTNYRLSIQVTDLNTSAYSLCYFNFTTWNYLVANFTYVINGSRVVFTDTSFSNDPVNYSIDSRYWNFGDGSQTDEINPAHWYYKTGTLTVKLIVENYNTHSIDVRSVDIYLVPPVVSVSTFDIVSSFDWGGFFIPMVFILIIIMLFIILFEYIKKATGRRKG